MKKVFIFGTKLHMYLCELPLLLFFVLSIVFNGLSMAGGTKGGLIPLIILTGAGMIFMFIYLFRAVLISGEYVRSVGLFSSRDRAIINKDKTLVLTVRPKHRIKIELFGKDEAPELDWVTKEDEDAREYANLYRDIAIGGDNTVRRVLLFFDVPRKDIDEAISADEYSKEFSLVSLSKEKTEHGPTYSIRFLKTI